MQEIFQAFPACFSDKQESLKVIFYSYSSILALCIQL